MLRRLALLGALTLPFMAATAGWRWLTLLLGPMWTLTVALLALRDALHGEVRGLTGWIVVTILWTGATCVMLSAPTTTPPDEVGSLGLVVALVCGGTSAVLSMALLPMARMRFAQRARTAVRHREPLAE
ncbi:MAG: hypothetical protein ACON5B_02005 [Myxococcota bacterium]